MIIKEIRAPIANFDLCNMFTRVGARTMKAKFVILLAQGRHVWLQSLVILPSSLYILSLSNKKSLKTVRSTCLEKSEVIFSCMSSSSSCRSLPSSFSFAPINMFCHHWLPFLSKPLVSLRCHCPDHPSKSPSPFSSVMTVPTPTHVNLMSRLHG